MKIPTCIPKSWKLSSPICEWFNTVLSLLLFFCSFLSYAFEGYRIKFENFRLYATLHTCTRILSLIHTRIHTYWLSLSHTYVRTIRFGTSLQSIPDPVTRYRDFMFTVAMLNEQEGTVFGPVTRYVRAHVVYACPFMYRVCIFNCAICIVQIHELKESSVFCFFSFLFFQLFESWPTTSIDNWKQIDIHTKC